jgi:hypothetical protein
MLLRISNKDFVDDLLHATKLAEGVLDYAAKRNGNDYDEADIKAKLKNGGWVTSKKALTNPLKNILALPKAARKALKEAVSNDIGFYEKLDEPDFDFRYPQLPEETRKVADVFLRQFYKILGSKSGFSKLDGQKSKQLNGAILEELYQQSNKENPICPACLILDLPLHVGGISQNDREHYFPQSKYPPLAVHPYNLTIACMICNQRRHSNIDPILTHKAGALLDSFLPYSRPGIEQIELQFKLTNASNKMVRLMGKKGLERAAERAKNFDRMYKLSELWSKRLEGLDRVFRTAVFTETTAPQLQDVKKMLERFVKIDEATKYFEPAAFLRWQYASWILSKHLDSWFNSNISNPAGN